MKYNLLITIFIVAIGLTVHCQDKWEPIHPKPTLYNLNDLHFNSQNEGWVVGVDGTILYTNDGGLNWITQHYNKDESFYSVYFINENEGWVVGWSDIYHTKDKGNIWEKQEQITPDPAYMGSLLDVFFLDSNNGWIVGTNKTILKTTDGGANWTKQMFSLGSRELQISSVFFTDEQHGTAVGGSYYPLQGLILTTNDGGITWDELVIDAPNSHGFNRVYFQDSLKGWITGMSGSVIPVSLYRTIDGGISWDTIGNQGGNITDIFFCNDTVGIILKGDLVQKTFNGGISWDSIVEINPPASLSRFSFWDSTGCYSAGNYGSICQSVDFGSTWHNISSGERGSFCNIGFFDSNSGLALKNFVNNISLFASHDGGYSWTCDTSFNSYSIYMLDVIGQSAFIIDYANQIHVTNNSGTDWVIRNLPVTNQFFNDIQFIDKNTGFLAGDEGVFISTSDGGQTWSNKYLPDDNNISNIFFLNDSDGWLISYNTKNILITNDGGITWTVSSLEPDKKYQPLEVYFINQNIGFVSASEGKLFKSFDKGNTWELWFSFPSSGQSTNMYFFDENKGWYNSASAVYQTTDGGATWDNEQYFFPYIINEDMFFLNDNTGWLSGSHSFVAFTDQYVGIDDIHKETDDVVIFPNPSNGNFVIQLSKNDETISEVIIYNMTGQILSKFAVNKKTEYINNMNTLANGCYFIYIKTQSKSYFKKIVIQ